MTFEDYLKEKKIDSEKFKTDDPEKWEEFSEIFLQVHPDSFTAQKLYLINGLRRKYLLIEAVEEVKALTSVKKSVKPVMKPKRPASKPLIKRPKTK